MLLSFSVANSRSFRELATLSMTRLRRRSDSTESWDGWSEASPVAGIYGANASGKSNLLAALSFLCAAVEHSHSKWSPDGGIPLPQRFALDSDSRGAAASFEVIFVSDGVRYQYGFEADSNRVLREWLYSVPKRQQRVIFERDALAGDEPWYFGDSLRGRVRAIAELTRDNSLFLSVAAMNNHAQLLPVFVYLTTRISFINDVSDRKHLSYTTLLMQQSDKAQAEILELVKRADLGIHGAEIDPAEVDDETVDDFAEFISRSAPAAGSLPPREELRELVSRAMAGLKLSHKGEDGHVATFPLMEESTGTLALLSLAGPVFEALESGRVLVVDEIDTSLHPVLVRALVNMFKSRDTNPLGAQLIFTSHDVTLLMQDMFDEALLDRDQVWFVEKTSDGSSKLYPLTDFKVRPSHSLLRGYLQGRYGGVPAVDWRRWGAGVS